MSKNILALILSLFFLFLMCGCLSHRDIMSECTSSHKAGEIQKELKLGMTFPDVVKLLDSTPIVLNNGSIHFILKDGDLWIRCSKDFDGLEHLSYWETKENLPDGKSEIKTSQDAYIAQPLRNPVCMNLTINNEFQGKKDSGSISYEDYGMGNTTFEFHKEGAGPLSGALCVINGKCLMVDGRTPAEEELNIMKWLILQVNLAQCFLSKSIPEGPPSVKEKKNVSLGSQKESLMIPMPGMERFVYPAPWSAKGSIEPAREGGGFDFDIDFGNWEYASGDKVHKMNLHGTWRIQDKTLPDSTPIDKWRIFQLDSKRGTVPIAKELNSLGDLRKYAPERDVNPAPPGGRP